MRTFNWISLLVTRLEFQYSDAVQFNDAINYLR